MERRKEIEWSGAIRKKASAISSAVEYQFLKYAQKVDDASKNCGKIAFEKLC